MADFNSTPIWEPPPPDHIDPMVEAYKRDVDWTMLHENLKLTVHERFERFDSAMEMFEELAAAGERSRRKNRSGSS